MRNHLLAVLIPAVLAPCGALAQEYYTRHNFTLGLGAGLPRGDLRHLFSDSFGLGVNYGYRFHRNFQADIGLDTLFGAAGVRDFLPTPFGDLRIRDFQFLVPMGGRVVVPFASERFHFSAGGGAAYMRYTERLRQPFSNSGFTIDCPVCSARDGWAYYGLVGADVALNEGRNFRLGVVSRVYRGHTEGDPLGNVPRVRTTDRWINIMGTFTFAF